MKKIRRDKRMSKTKEKLTKIFLAKKVEVRNHVTATILRLRKHKVYVAYVFLLAYGGRVSYDRLLELLTSRYRRRVSIKVVEEAELLGLFSVTTDTRNKKLVILNDEKEFSRHHNGMDNEFYIRQSQNAIASVSDLIGNGKKSYITWMIMKIGALAQSEYSRKKRDRLYSGQKKIASQYGYSVSTMTRAVRNTDTPIRRKRREIILYDSVNPHFTQMTRDLAKGFATRVRLRNIGTFGIMLPNAYKSVKTNSEIRVKIVQGDWLAEGNGKKDSIDKTSEKLRHPEREHDWLLTKNEKKVLKSYLCKTEENCREAFGHGIPFEYLDSKCASLIRNDKKIKLPPLFGRILNSTRERIAAWHRMLETNYLSAGEFPKFYIPSLEVFEKEILEMKREEDWEFAGKITEITETEVFAVLLKHNPHLYDGDNKKIYYDLENTPRTWGKNIERIPQYHYFRHEGLSTTKKGMANLPPPPSGLFKEKKHWHPTLTEEDRHTEVILNRDNKGRRLAPLRPQTFSEVPVMKTLRSNFSYQHNAVMQSYMHKGVLTVRRACEIFSKQYVEAHNVEYRYTPEETNNHAKAYLGKRLVNKGMRPNFKKLKNNQRVNHTGSPPFQ